jgi:hypothetical protein
MGYNLSDLFFLLVDCDYFFYLPLPNNFIFIYSKSNCLILNWISAVKVLLSDGMNVI